MTTPRSYEELVEDLRAFQVGRTLLTALELDVFRAAENWVTGEEVARAISADARATEMLLNALVALGALEKAEGSFRCTPASWALGQGRRGLMHTVNRWHTWSTLTESVRAGSAQGPEPVGRDEAWTRDFIEAMDAHAQALAPALVRTVGTAGVARMLDVGGGPATFAIAFARADPALRAEIMDQPAVVPLAEKKIREAGLEDRITAWAGDLTVDDLGTGFDLVLVSAICHMLSEAQNRDLLRRVSKALNPGGRIVLRDFLLEPDRTAPREAALFALNMLVGTRAGNVYTEKEYRGWLAEAGLSAVTRPEGPALLIAIKI